MSKSILLTALMAVILTAGAYAQTKDYDLAEIYRRGEVIVYNRTAKAIDEGGKKGVYMTADKDDGILLLDNVTFTDGTIELDIKGRDSLQKSFVGVAFHAEDGDTYDAVYFRPFNFLAADSVRRIHAVQYVSHPVWTWDKLRKEKNGKFEHKVPEPPDPNGWFHVKIVVNHPSVTVFVNDKAQPVLDVKQLSTRKKGQIGLMVGNASDGSFANLRITPKE